MTQPSTTAGAIPPGTTDKFHERYQAMLVEILTSGALRIFSGKVEINIHNAQIQNIKVTEVKFRRERVPIEEPSDAYNSM